METLVQEKSPLFKMLPEGVRDWYFEEMLGQMYETSTCKVILLGWWVRVCDSVAQLAATFCRDQHCQP